MRRSTVARARMRRIVGIMCGAVLLSVGSSASALASTIFFTNRAAWDAAVSGEVTDTYESYPWTSPGGDLIGSSGVLGDYSYTNSGGAIFGVDSTALTYDAAYLTGQYLEWQGGSPNNELATVVLPGSFEAIGLDYGQFNGTVTTFVIALGNGDSTTVLSNLNDYAFFGAISTVPFSSFSIISAPFPIIDNLSRADAAQVPEPPSLLLFTTMLTGFAASRWRRRPSRFRGIGRS